MNAGNLPIKLMNGLLSIPGAKIHRQEFLQEVLLPYVSDKDKLKNVDNIRPWSLVSHGSLDLIAKERISYRKKIVTTTSFLAGLPGGFGMFASVPADVVQYQYHLLVLAQELAYLYGMPEFYDENGNATEQTTQALVVMFFGMREAIGHGAREGVEQFIKAVAKGAPERIAHLKWGNTALFRAIKEIAKWLGIKGGQDISKKEIGKAAGKVIPIFGGLISGGLSCFLFGKDSNRFLIFLQKHKKLFMEADENKDS